MLTFSAGRRFARGAGLLALRTLRWRCLLGRMMVDFNADHPAGAAAAAVGGASVWRERPVRDAADRRPERVVLGVELPAVERIVWPVVVQMLSRASAMRRGLPSVRKRVGDVCSAAVPRPVVEEVSV